MSSETSEWMKIAAAVILPNCGGWINGILSRGQIRSWYKKLKRPKGCPPSGVFGPVWTFLYSSMGYASYLVWRDGGGFGGEAGIPLTIYGAQLVLNNLYTPIFFIKHDIPLAFKTLVALLGSIGVTSWLFYGINQTAALLLLPYAAWVSYATYLNYGFMKLNPDSKSITD